MAMRVGLVTMTSALGTSASDLALLIERRRRRAFLICWLPSELFESSFTSSVVIFKSCAVFQNW